MFTKIATKINGQNICIHENIFIHFHLILEFSTLQCSFDTTRKLETVE